MSAFSPSKWASSRMVAVGGVVLAVFTAVTFGTLAWLQFQERLNDERAKAAMLARVFEDEAARTVESASVVLTGMATQLQSSTAPDDPTWMSSVLAQSVVGLPALRSVAVLDDKGRVLASSDSRDVDVVVAPDVFGPAPAPGRDRLAPPMNGRTLDDASAAGRQRPHPPGVAFIPLLRSVSPARGAALTLVALINPDALSNYQEQVLPDEADAALLSNYDGVVLASTRSSGLAVGQRVDTLPAFKDYLPATEHGTYIGLGARDGAQIVGFRASHTRPLVAMVEHSRAVAVAHWANESRWFGLISVGAVFFILAMTALASRSLRSREATRQELDGALMKVAVRERELSVVVRSVQELIFRTDAEGVLNFVNDRWNAVGNNDTAQALGRPMADLVAPTDRAVIAGLFASGGSSGIRTARFSMDGPGGSTRHFDVAVIPLQSHDKIVGFAGSAVDVTARLQAEQELRNQLAFSGLLLEISPLPMSLIGVDNRFITVNQAWQEFRGLDRDEVIGKAAGSFLPPDQAAAHGLRDAELLAKGGQMRYETTVVARDGSVRDIVITKVVVPKGNGTPLGILSVSMDVSEFRAAERATREARDMAEEASRSKTEFIANISHELRTPLQSILGFSELGALRGREHQRLSSMFTDIHTAGQRMLALVNDLLDVSKIESSVGTFHLERTDIRQAVRSVMDELSPLLAQKQLSLATQLGDAPLVAKIDPLRFQQVVRNVLANAIKFSPACSRIEVDAYAEAAGTLELNIRDHGPGIPASELEKIFDAFVQSSLTKDGSGGTGLGLAISRKIMAAQGGQIWATNMADGGSCFHIQLPARGFAETMPATL